MINTDEIYKITDNLQKHAGAKLREAQATYEGYYQACEDFASTVSEELIVNPGSNLNTQEAIIREAAGLEFAFCQNENDLNEVYERLRDHLSCEMANKAEELGLDPDSL